MTRAVRLTTYAQADLDQLFSYIGRDNPRAAEQYVQDLRERCAFYAEAPMLGLAEPRIAQRLRQPADRVRSFLYRNHRCYYLITDDEIRVLGFIDTRRDLDRALEERRLH